MGRRRAGARLTDLRYAIVGGGHGAGLRDLRRGDWAYIAWGCPLSLRPVDNITFHGTFLFGTCQALFTSRTDDMSFSPTPSQDSTSIIGQLWTCLETWERSASLDERVMLMAEFITMYSQISDGSFRREKFVYSMWEASTQTSSLLDALQRKLTTTRSRMGTLLREGLEGRAEIAIGTLIISGLRRHMLDLLTSFCTFATNWLREILCGASQTSGLTPIGNGTTEWPYTISPLALSLTRQRLRESMSGCHSLLLDLASHERGTWVFAPNVGLKRWGRFGGKPPAPPRPPLPLHIGVGM